MALDTRGNSLTGGITTAGGAASAGTEGTGTVGAGAVGSGVEPGAGGRDGAVQLASRAVTTQNSASSGRVSLVKMDSGNGRWLAATDLGDKTSSAQGHRAGAGILCQIVSYFPCFFAALSGNQS